MVLSLIPNHLSGHCQCHHQHQKKGDSKKGAHPGTGVTPGQPRKLLRPSSCEYLGHCKATFIDKLLLIGLHIQRTQRTYTSLSTPCQMHYTWIALAYSINPEWGLACHDMGSLLYTSRGHANSQTVALGSAFQNMLTFTRNCPSQCFNISL